MLTIRPHQQRELADEHFRRRAVSFLRTDAAELTQQMSDADLDATVERAAVTGREIGISSERELVKWAFVGVLTRGEAFDDERVKGPLRDLGSADQTKVDALLIHVALELGYRS
jgi:hypothetical protein